MLRFFHSSNTLTKNRLEREMRYSKSKKAIVALFYTGTLSGAYVIL